MRLSIHKPRLPISPTKLVIGLGGILVISGMVGYVFVDDYNQKHEKAVITSNKIEKIAARGVIVVDNKPSREVSQTKFQAEPHQRIEYTTDSVAVNHSSNAAVVTWNQSGENGVKMQVRTKNGSKWTEWTEVSKLDGGKDGTQKDGEASSLVLANNIDAFQLRTTLNGGSSGSSQVDLSDSELTAIDSSRGPSGKATLKDKLFGAFNLQPTATALRADAPNIISRGQWGSPEPTWSSWPQDYAKLARAIIHHTASTESSDSYADVRAIWQYHAISLGWGDIGYNYVVDSKGQIFEGRYSNHAYAKNNNVDVVGGHAYDNNVGTTGISMIGNFDKTQPTQAAINAVAHMVGYKLASYNIDPRGVSVFGDAVVGHFLVSPTSCPGVNVRSRVGEIRNLAAGPFEMYRRYALYDYDHIYQKTTLNGVDVTNTPVNPGDVVEISMGLRNKGLVPWENTGASPVVLATDRPTDRTSELYHPTWLGRNRLATFSSKLDEKTGQLIPATSIAPDEVGVFTFKMTAPGASASGSQTVTKAVEYLRPVREGVSWFPRDIGMYPPLTIKTYDWGLTGQDSYTDETLAERTPSTLMPNTRYYMLIKAKNTGSATWRKSTMRMGTSAPLDRQSGFADSSWLSRSRPVGLKETEVLPGQIGTFGFWITTPSPSETTTYREFFRPVAEGQTWLKDINMHWEYRVQKHEVSWQWLGQDVYADPELTTSAPSTLTPGNTYYAVLRFKNTGTIPLKRDSPLALATSNPMDRTSSFQTADWLSQNRVARIKENVVNHGQDGTFVFTIRAPHTSTAGWHREYFRPVIDGVGWLQDYGVYYDFYVDAVRRDWTPVSQQLFTDETQATQAPSTLTANQRYYVVLTVKNTGNTAWPTHTTKIGTINPRDHSSVLYTNGWIAPNRITENTNEVKAGDTYRYKFWITTSNDAAQKDSFGLVIDGVAWLPDRSLTIPSP